VAASTTRRGRAVKLRRSSANLLAIGLLSLIPSLLWTGDAPAATETWLCPVCQVQRVARPEGATDLTCPKCAMTLSQEDLRWRVAYIAVGSRPTSVVWFLIPECGIFRNDGLLAYDKLDSLWIPWSAVEYYIPRQRIIRLTSGTEFLSPYSKGPDCEKPPVLTMSVADSVGDFMKGRSIEVTTKQEDMSSLHCVARSRPTLDSARVRFIDEVMAGKHPRLPRTQPNALRTVTPTVPQSAMQDSLDVILEARLAETGRILKVNRLKGSGNEEVDRAALLATYRTVMVSGGEMGMGIPSSMVLHFIFNRGTATVDVKPAVPPMWREWVDVPIGSPSR
jgi:hypothetical protein